MKNKPSLIVSISSLEDIEKITKFTKYINLDITNCSSSVIDYFIKNGQDYLYSSVIDGVCGYVYVPYEDLSVAESIIDYIYASMPYDLNDLEMARYLYIAICKRVCFDINVSSVKNDTLDLTLINSVNNIWSSLSLGRVNDMSLAKIYYYLCKRVGLNVEYIANYQNKEAHNKLIINNQILNVYLFSDVPYVQASMKTRNFATYNDDVRLDKKIKYIKNNYNDYYIDNELKNIDYTKDTFIEDILYKTQKIIPVISIKPVELSIIYRYIFDKYCSSYHIEINNLYLRNDDKYHFIMISYDNSHYSYNYKMKSFVKVNDYDIINNIYLKKIGLYQDELIPNIEINMNY